MPFDKKLRTVSVLTLTILLILICTGSANAEITISFEPSEMNVEEDQEFTLDITVKSDVNVSGAEMELSLDPSLINITSVSEGEFLKQSGYSTIFSNGTIDNEKGTVTNIYSVIMGDDRHLEDGTFATITLRSKDERGITKLRMDNVVITNSAGEKLPVTVNSADIVVGDAADMNTIGEESNEEDTGSPKTGHNSLHMLTLIFICLCFAERKIAR